MQSRRRATSKFTVQGTPVVYGFPAELVQTYEDFCQLSEKQRHRQAIYYDKGPNLVVNAGLNQIANLISGVNLDYAGFCGVGSSSTAVSATDTALITQIGSRVVPPAGGRYLEATGKAHVDTFFGANDNNGSWRETGLFTLSTGGSMFCRRVITLFTKATTNTAVVAWTITLTAV